MALGLGGKSDVFELEILNLIFQNANIANIGDATGLRGSTTVGSLYVALHTADPFVTTETGVDQLTTEANYTSYARVAVARTSGGWTTATASGTTTAKPTAAITFPACTGGTNTITHASVGVAASGASKILYSGPVTPNIAVTTGVTPSLATTSAIEEG